MCLANQLFFVRLPAHSTGRDCGRVAGLSPNTRQVISLCCAGPLWRAHVEPGKPPEQLQDLRCRLWYVLKLVSHSLA